MIAREPTSMTTILTQIKRSRLAASLTQQSISADRPLRKSGVNQVAALTVLGLGLFCTGCMTPGPMHALMKRIMPPEYEEVNTSPPKLHRSAVQTQSRVADEADLGLEQGPVTDTDSTDVSE